MSPGKALVLITTSFPIGGDGSEAAGSFVSDLAEELGKHLNVRVVAPGISNAREHWAENVEVFRFAAPDQPLSTLKPWRLADLLTIRRVLAAGESATRSAVEVGPTAHILALWALPSGHWARRMLQDFGLPYSIWALGSDIWSLGRVPVLRSYLRRVLVAAEHRYADGLQLGGDVEKISGKPCEFMPSARRLEAEYKRDVAGSPPYRLAFLGRWHRNKGVDLFLDALALLSDEDWSRISEIRVRGGGPLEPDVNQAVMRLQSQGRPVDIGGYLGAEQAIELFCWTDYVVLPSRVESIPVVFSDAAQLGRPLVATPVGDLPRLYAQNQFGVLARAASTDAIAAAIREALDIPPSMFTSQLATLARQFDIELVAQDFARRVAPLEGSRS